MIARFSHFVIGSLLLVTRGNRLYWTWIGVLALLIASGLQAFAHQVSTGLVVTAMRERGM
jgi:molybdopterin-containing oxidoreductase family membrane subunit